jgi:hypothetical protein
LGFDLLPLIAQLATLAFRMGSLGFTGLDGLNCLEICWSNRV